MRNILNRKKLMTRVVCISDTHNQHEKIKLVDGNIIVCTGDITGTGTNKQIMEFLNWYSELNYEYKILIAGNHDWGFEKKPGKYERICKELGIIYLNDNGCSIKGINFWGSPVQPAFCNWAFNRARSLNSSLDFMDKEDFGKNPIKSHWDQIPNDIDVLLTHGPPRGILDECYERSVGCDLLRDKVFEIKPRLHVFGHIHECRGEKFIDDIRFINASCLDGKYVPYAMDRDWETP